MSDTLITLFPYTLCSIPSNPKKKDRKKELIDRGRRDTIDDPCLRISIKEIDYYDYTTVHGVWNREARQKYQYAYGIMEYGLEGGRVRNGTVRIRFRKFYIYIAYKYIHRKSMEMDTGRDRQRNGWA